MHLERMYCRLQAHDSLIQMLLHQKNAQYQNTLYWLPAMLSSKAMAGHYLPVQKNRPIKAVRLWIA